MRVAAIYDIHGNLPALEAVLAAIRVEDVDQIVVGGDVVPGPMPRECLSTLRDLPIPLRFIRGNGEADVLAVRRGETPARVPERLIEVLRWAAKRLSTEDLADLAAWPTTSRLAVSGLGDVLFCHATPRDDSEIFTRVTPERRLRLIFEAAGAALVICGHTHMQFDRRVGDVRVVNAGSVGMPFGEPGAYWALLGPGGVELRRTTYDLDAAEARIRATGFPAEYEVRRPRSESQMLEVFEAAALR